MGCSRVQGGGASHTKKSSCGVQLLLTISWGGQNINGGPCQEGWYLVLRWWVHSGAWCMLGLVVLTWYLISPFFFPSLPSPLLPLYNHPSPPPKAHGWARQLSHMSMRDCRDRKDQHGCVDHLMKLHGF